jgi:hypothetical protein
MTLQQAPRSVIGYHGCSREAAEAILAENQFLVSTNTYDWLGNGVYFWEYAPYRALEWARERYEAYGTEPAVLSATLRLGDCLNLLDRKHFAELEAVYTRIMQSLPEERRLRNTSAGAHYLDRYIIDAYCRFANEETTTPFQTVRGSFPEGEPIYPGSKLLKKTHTQIAVRDLSCISRVRLVQFP